MTNEQKIDWPEGADAVIRCQGCGRIGRMWCNDFGQWFDPRSWYSRRDDDGVQIACSRECIGKVSKASGKHDVVAPF